MSGLRERKKLRTQEALSWAALRLTVERGLEHVLVEDIAAEAGVSPRTFNNYFSSKAEAIAWRHLNRARQAADLIRERPGAEPLWESITQAVLQHAGGEHRQPDPQWTAGVRIMLAEPALFGEYLKANAKAAEEVTVAIAERTGTNATDMYPRLVAAAVMAANQAAIEQWVNADPPVPLLPLLTEAVNQFAAGLPDPSA
ncbi:MAG: TetR family transcriptional regulator [Actinophytocola sp.]|uniref:TetR/AcrR family transcriptional regulator n=1 Tax=Actinophytocola sp. TaxID=1872138 RepID=UPI0013283841|nr:TetR family transcriptional regulator [Actinophytocola sp.]MPZ84188.1 TetR family transcriptional regulator [Actinophytocola sp.]